MNGRKGHWRVNDHSMDVILMIKADFGALNNIHSVIFFSYANSLLFLILFNHCLKL